MVPGTSLLLNCCYSALFEKVRECNKKRHRNKCINIADVIEILVKNLLKPGKWAW